MYIYPTQMEITYDQGSEFIGNDYRRFLIEIEYRIPAKPITLGNLTSNAILERIHQVLGDLVRNFSIKYDYVDGDDPWSSILAAAAFLIHSITNRLKVYSTGQLLFCHKRILPINHRVDSELIRQQNQMQI